MVGIGNLIGPGDMIFVNVHSGYASTFYFTYVKIIEGNSISILPPKYHDELIDISSNAADLYDNSGDILCTNVCIRKIMLHGNIMFIASLRNESLGLNNKHTRYTLHSYGMVEGKSVRIINISHPGFTFLSEDKYRENDIVELDYKGCNVLARVKRIAYGDNVMRAYLCLLTQKSRAFDKIVESQKSKYMSRTELLKFDY